MHFNSQLLKGKFSASQVARAAGCSEDAMTNYIFKNHLYLCSEAPGRGRKRQFPIVDVLQIALMTSVVRLSRDAHGSMAICDGALFAGTSYLIEKTHALENREPTSAEIIQEYGALAKTFSEDIGNAPKPYHEFDLSHPWILMFEVSEGSRASKPYWFKWGGKPIWPEPDISQGWYLNVTRTFVSALEKLQEVTLSSNVDNEERKDV